MLLKNDKLDQKSICRENILQKWRLNKDTFRCRNIGEFTTSRHTCSKRIVKESSSGIRNMTWEGNLGH